MSIKSLLLAGTLIPALAMSMPANLSAANDGAIVLAQAQPVDPDAKKNAAPKKPAPAAQPAKPPAGAAQPAKPPAGAAQPAKPPAGAAQPAKPPAGAAQPAKPPAGAAQRPATQRPATPPNPAAQKPTTPPRPAAQTPPARQPASTRAPASGELPGSRAPAAQGQSAPKQLPTAQTPAARKEPGSRATGQGRPGPGQGPAAQTPGNQPGQNRGAIQANPPRQVERGPQRLEEIRGGRRETKEGNRTIIRETNRTIIRENGRAIIRHNEAERFSRFSPGARSERRGRETFITIVRPGGFRIVTVVDADGRLIRRVRRGPDGREFIIIDNRVRGPGIGFFVELPPPVIRIPRERYIVAYESAPPLLVYQTLLAPPVMPIERAYSLDEVRYSPALRDRMPRIDLDTINFETGSWDLAPDQIDRLAAIADGIKKVLAERPDEVFLIEGHTDAVGTEEDNLSLSDRRAEAVAVALTEQFQVPPENLTSQGYGEQNLKVPTPGPEPQNRRVTVRRITPLLTGQNEPPA